jgi:hypothetical protein
MAAQTLLNIKLHKHSRSLYSFSISHPMHYNLISLILTKAHNYHLIHINIFKTTQLLLISDLTGTSLGSTLIVVV